MSSKENTDRKTNDFLVFLRTILLILKNHKFKNTVEILEKECLKLGYDEVAIKTESPQNRAKTPSVIVIENLANAQSFRIVVDNSNEVTVENIQAKSQLNSENTSHMHKNNEEADKSSINSDTKFKSYIPVYKNNDRSRESSPQRNKSRVSSPDRIENKNITPDNKNELPTLENSGNKQKEAHKEFVQKEVNANSKDYNALKRRFSSLQEEHHKLMDVVSELTFALQTSIKGQQNMTHTILNNCEKIYPELFFKKPSSPCESAKSNRNNQNTQENVREKDKFEHIGITAKEIISNCKEGINNDLSKPDPTYKIPFFDLDYKKIKNDLKDGDLNLKLLLLQALRWRITKTKNPIREEIVRAYQQFDLLNIHNCSHRTGLSYPKNSIVFISFYCSCASPHTLQQSVARLLNALASVKIGREYIAHQSVIISILLSIFLESHPSAPHIDEVTRYMIIATLQKMSLSYSARICMITDGFVEYMVTFLSNNYQTVNEYCLEYSTALLRNLWLHSDARVRCYPMANDVIKLLAALLHEQYSICLPYITGSLYSLLIDPYYNQAAKDINLENILEYRIEKVENEMKFQLHHILEVCMYPERFPQSSCDCPSNKDTEYDMDILEPEIDLSETFQFSTANGEAILSNYRLQFTGNVTLTKSNELCTVFSGLMTPNYHNYRSSSTCSMSNNYSAKFVNERMNNEQTQKSNENETVYTENHVEENLNYSDEQKQGMDENKNKVRTPVPEMTFCEDTQQYYFLPTKDGIFENEKSRNLHAIPPSFLQYMVYNDVSVDQAKKSRSLPVSPKSRTRSPILSPKSTAQYLYSPNPNPHINSCYREGFKPRSYSENNTPYVGFCDENGEKSSDTYNKYTCDCYNEMQKSFEEEPKKSYSNSNYEKINNLTTRSDARYRQKRPEFVLVREKESKPRGRYRKTERRYCKYKCFPNVIQNPCQSSAQREKSPSSRSKCLDESNYSDVFESRPRLTRTP